MKRFVLSLSLSCLVVTASPAQLRHGIVYYTPHASEDVKAKVAARYDIGLTEWNYADPVDVKDMNPSFKWFVYNSGTDNYRDGREEGIVNEVAFELGLDPEAAYLHFMDDTEIVLEGDTLFIPGYPEGSAGSLAEARAPVYYKNGSRLGLNFTGNGGEIHRKAMIRWVLGQTFPDSDYYADGLFLDNCSPVPWQAGSRVSGGKVYETGGEVLWASDEYQDWHWNTNLAPFLQSLKDTLEISASWSPDGKRKELSINTSTKWDDSYITYDVADIIVREGPPSTVRSYGLNSVLDMYEINVAGEAAGIAMFYLGRIDTTVASTQDPFSHPQALMSNMAFWLASRVPSTYFFAWGTFKTVSPDWEYKTWAPGVDVINAELGEAVGEPSIFRTGTDPMGHDYAITARPYQNGLVIVRPRGRWDEPLDYTTGVPVTLDEPMRLISPDGQISFSVNQVTLRNAEGAVLLAGEGGPGGGDPPATAQLSSSLLLMGTSPRHGAVDVPSVAEIRISLSDPLNSSAVDASWITVVGSASGTRAGAVSLADGGRRLIFVPDEPWTPGEQVSVVVRSTVSRVDGERLDANRDGVGGATADDFSFQFHVAP